MTTPPQTPSELDKELLPCPFCGNVPQLYEGKNYVVNHSLGCVVGVSRNNCNHWITGRKAIALWQNQSAAKHLKEVEQANEYCCKLLKDCGLDEAAPLEKLVRSIVARTNELEQKLKDSGTEIHTARMKNKELKWELAQMHEQRRAFGQKLSQQKETK